MDKKRRIDVRSILAQPDLRRALMVPTIQATQAREGIETTREQAERAYYIVTEAERVAFFALRELSGGLSDRRETGFAQALGIPLDDAPVIRYDVARRDFGTIPRSPLSYAQVAILSQLVRETPRLDLGWACARGGMNSTESPRFVRYWWEPSPNTSRRWVPYSKGGSYARFYSDLELVFDWTDHGSEFRQIVKRKYGSESRFVKSPEFYFRRGITWTEKSSLGFSARLLEEGAIFNVAGPAAFPTNRQDDEWYLLGVLNSDLLAYVAWAFSGRSYGASYIAALPIAPRNQMSKRIAEVAKDSHAFKAAWDQGNEASTRFDRPWILMKGLTDETMAIGPRLDELVAREAAEDARIQELYAALNDAVYQQYGIPDRSRASIEETLGKRPLEVLWPQMEGKTVEQKRMEHVFRFVQRFQHEKRARVCLWFDERREFYRLMPALREHLAGMTHAPWHLLEYDEGRRQGQIWVKYEIRRALEALDPTERKQMRFVVYVPLSEDRLDRAGAGGEARLGLLAEYHLAGILWRVGGKLPTLFSFLRQAGVSLPDAPAERRRLYDGGADSLLAKYAAKFVGRPAAFWTATLTPEVAQSRLIGDADQTILNLAVEPDGTWNSLRDKGLDREFLEMVRERYGFEAQPTSPGDWLRELVALLALTETYLGYGEPPDFPFADRMPPVSLRPHHIQLLQRWLRDTESRGAWDRWIQEVETNSLW